MPDDLEQEIRLLLDGVKAVLSETGLTMDDLVSVQVYCPDLTLYGLRHTVAVILRECGFDERTIADALGQKTIEMARHYAKGADLTEKLRGVAKEFEREVNSRRTKVSNPAGEVSNLDTKFKQGSS